MMIPYLRIQRLQADVLLQPKKVQLFLGSLLPPSPFQLCMEALDMI